ncbi:acyltransferase-domain-containing protein [Peniophora sp. CONT]|nr:acyltransferase-domain-containing protein [Peniophora sp. CONT]
MSKLLSKATVTAVGLTCKSVLNLGLCSMTVNGLPNIMRALESEERNNGRGIVTVSNHISTLDDPMTWGVMPVNTYWNPRKTRWVLGAADIMFTNPILSAFFRKGQVIETFRGKGIYQPAVDLAIQKLTQGEWLHLFGEGYVSQPALQSVENNKGRLRRFKWGIGRMLMETPRPPVIIPMWIAGFDTLMPEGRRFPFNFIPRLGAKLSVTFGEPISPEDILSALQHRTGIPANTSQKASSWIAQTSVEHAGEGMRRDLATDEESRDIRIAVTDVVQRAVEALGRRVSGNMLGKQDP